MEEEKKGESTPPAGTDAAAGAKGVKESEIMERMAFLKGVPLFQGLDEARLRETATRMLPRQFRAHEVIIRQGDEGTPCVRHNT